MVDNTKKTETVKTVKPKKVVKAKKAKKVVQKPGFIFNFHKKELTKLKQSITLSRRKFVQIHPEISLNKLAKQFHLCTGTIFNDRKVLSTRSFI